MKLFSSIGQHIMNKNIFKSINTFSKWITVIWLLMWIETLLFSQLAVLFSFGDVMAIQSINSTVTDLGTIIAAFYFSSKTFENVAQGLEQHDLIVKGIKKLDAADDDVKPVL